MKTALEPQFGRSWLAPAKLNLFLHITGQREDGYHLLQTIFQFLDYSDELFFELSENNLIQLETSFEGLAAEDNLIYKAAKLVQERLKEPKGVSIRIDKKLPMGGGLGGGSSNAATTLVALNELWDAGIGLDDLAIMGLSLGADVPVFVRGCAAWAEGVGENLTPVVLDEPWVVVVVPSVSVSTQKIFSHKSLTRDQQAITIRDFLGGLPVGNICEEIVTKAYPEVANALEFLDTTQPQGSARMTGTGSCVFAMYPSESGAKNALAKMPEEWQGFIAKTCNQSPLFSVE